MWTFAMVTPDAMVGGYLRFVLDRLAAHDLEVRGARLIRLDWRRLGQMYLHREDPPPAGESEGELLPLCRDQGLGVIAYNPLAGGFLSGKYRSLEAPSAGTRFTLGKTGELYRERYWHQAQLEAVEHLRGFFAPRGKSLVTAAVAWVLGQPGITSAIVGASRPEQLDESLAATSMTLDEKEQEACNLAWFSLPRPATPPR